MREHELRLVSTEDWSAGLAKPSMKIIQPPRYFQIDAVIVCPDCEEFHPVRVWCCEGKPAGSIIIGSGAGAGYAYSLTGEDLGGDGERSIPVYRASCSVTSDDIAGLLG